MEYNPSSKILCANFVNLQLKKIKRTEKKASESVMDEKSALLFTTEFFIEEDLRFTVKVRQTFTNLYIFNIAYL